MALAIGVLGVAFSFGPGLPGYGWLHQHLPLLAGLRNAARWGWLGLASVSMLAGFGVAWLEQAWQRRAVLLPSRSPAWVALCVVLGMAATAEAIRTPVGFTRFTGVPAIYDRLASEPRAVLIEFPFFSGRSFAENGPYLLNNTRSFTPLVNGYSGFQSAAYLERGKVLNTFPATAALTELKRIGVTHVTVHTADFADRFGRGALAAIDQASELALVTESEGIRLYAVR